MTPHTAWGSFSKYHGPVDPKESVRFDQMQILEMFGKAPIGHSPMSNVFVGNFRM